MTGCICLAEVSLSRMLILISSRQGTQQLSLTFNLLEEWKKYHFKGLKAKSRYHAALPVPEGIKLVSLSVCELVFKVCIYFSISLNKRQAVQLDKHKKRRFSQVTTVPAHLASQHMEMSSF